MNGRSTLVRSIQIAVLIFAPLACFGQGPYSMILTSENNDGTVYTGAGHPMAVCAIIRNGMGTVVTGIMVNFEFQNAVGAWTVSAASVAPNTCGQAVVSVNCPQNGTATLHAWWGQSGRPGAPPDIKAESFMTLSTATGTQRGDSGTDPAYANWGRVVPSFGIPWANNSIFYSNLAAGASVWNSTGYASFTLVSLEDAYLVITQDFCDGSDDRFAYTAKGISGYTIAFNLFNCNPCPIGGCNGLGPPIYARTHLNSTAAHEFGHVLGLGHTNDGALTGNDAAALMWSSTRKWFFYGTLSPMPDEINGLIALGYVHN